MSSSKNSSEADSRSVTAHTTAALTSDEIRLAQGITALRASMERDLERFVAIPTGTGHEAGLAELRAIMRARLAALGAEIDEIAGDPRPAWIVQPGQRADATPPSSLRAVARGGGEGPSSSRATSTPCTTRLARFMCLRANPPRARSAPARST